MRLMTKDIKMLAIDLDGTLLHDDMSISPFTADILKKAWTKGIRIVFATGHVLFCQGQTSAIAAGRHPGGVLYRSMDCPA